MSDLIIQRLPSSFELKQVETSKKGSKKKSCTATYQFNISGTDARKIISHLSQKKNETFNIFSGAMGILLFSNLVTGPSFIARTINVLLSGTAFTVAIGSAYQHWVQTSTLEKVKLLFGNSEEQKESLIDLSKHLPAGYVTKTKEVSDYNAL